MTYAISSKKNRTIGTPTRTSEKNPSTNNGTGEARSGLVAAQELVIGALTALIEETAGEVKDLLAKVVGGEADEIGPLLLSMNACAESPMLGCVSARSRVGRSMHLLPAGL